MYNRALDKKILKELGEHPAPVPALRKFIPEDTGWLAMYKSGGEIEEYQQGGQRHKPTVEELTNLLNYMENPPPPNLHPKRVGEPEPSKPAKPVVMIGASNTPEKARKAAGKRIEEERKAQEIRQAAITKAVDEETQVRVQERLAAQKAYKDKKTPFTFPNGQTKSYDQMDWREKRYVGAKSLEADSRFVEDDESWWDTFSPLSWVGSMAANLGQAPYEARETNSIVPYVTSIATPIVMGRGIGANKLNPISKSFWTNTALTDKQFAKTLVNPLYGMFSKKKPSSQITDEMISKIQGDVNQGMFKTNQDEALKYVYDQFADPGSRSLVEKAFPQEIIDMATKKFGTNKQVVSTSQGMDAVWDKVPGYNSHMFVKPGYVPPTTDSKLAATLFKQQKGGPIVNHNGYKNGVPPEGSNWRIPGDTLYNPTGFNIWAQPNKGQGKWLDAYNTSNVKFPGADYVDEYHMQRGGERKPIVVNNPRDPRLKAYTDSLTLYNYGNQAEEKLKKAGNSLGVTKPWYDAWSNVNNNPGVVKAFNSLSKLNKRPPDPIGQGKERDVWENSTVVGKAYTNLYKKPVQPIVYAPGRMPIAVKDPNDPRLKAYNDSLSLYNKGIKNKKEITNVREFPITKDNEEEVFYWFKDLDRKPTDNIRTGDNTEAWRDWKKTGILPDREFIGNYDRPDKLATRYGWGYKKPVQPYILETPPPAEIKDYPIREPLPKAKTKITITPGELAEMPVQAPTNWSFTYPGEKGVNEQQFFNSQAEYEAALKAAASGQPIGNSNFMGSKQEGDVYSSQFKTKPKYNMGGERWLETMKKGGQRLTAAQYAKERGLKDAHDRGDFDNITPNEARRILHAKKINGHKLTPEQFRLFGFLSEGNTMKYQMGGGWLNQYQAGGDTLVKDKKVGELLSQVKEVDLKNRKYKGPLSGIVEKPNCPDGIGCSEQATDYVANDLGIDRTLLSPQHAAYRSSQFKRDNAKELFNPYPKGTKINTSGYNYTPITKDVIDSLQYGDFVNLDHGNDEVAIASSYDKPAYMTPDENNDVSHWGVVVGRDENGNPLIRHGWAGDENKGEFKVEPLILDKPLTIGKKDFRVATAYRPKAFIDNGISASQNVIDKGSDIAKRKQQTTSATGFYLGMTDEEKLIKDLPVAAEFSGANVRLNTKKKLEGFINNKKLDDELKYALGITQDDLDGFKPVVYGIAGQESGFGDVNSVGASLKDVPGNLMNMSNSKGLFQIKYSSLTPQERKIIGINSPNDLLDDEKAYKAAILMMKNAKERVDKEVEEGTHPGLVDKDPYFRAAYYYNSPARAITTAEDWAKRSNPVTLDPVTWLNKLKTRERDGLFSSVNKEYKDDIELRMDEGSYPYKLMQMAKDLKQYLNLDEATPVNMEEVVLHSSGNKKKKFIPIEKFGGEWLKQYNS